MKCLISSLGATALTRILKHKQVRVGSNVWCMWLFVCLDIGIWCQVNGIKFDIAQEMSGRSFGCYSI